MKAQVLSLIALTALTPLGLAQVVPGNPDENGLIPRTATFDANTDLNNTSTESTGVGIAANGNVIIGWEDDSLEDYQIFFWGAVWTLFDRDGMLLTPITTITNITAPAPYDVAQAVDTSYRAYFRADGTPTPGNTGWGPKIKANPFGDGLGMGSSTYFLGREVTNFFDINVDSGGGDDFPSVQLINNDGTPAQIVSMGDADMEPSGGVRIADWEYLSNGNIVIVGESRQADDRMLTGQPGGNTPVYRIVTPTGTQVKAYTAASSEPAAGDMWHGVGVTANGFALRFNQGGVATVRMFDNSGNPTTANISLATLTGHPEAGGGGRGDGAGFHGNGTDAYVHVATGGGTPWVTVINANGTLRWSRKIADNESDPNPASDRVDGAIAPDGRVIAVWDDNTAVAGTRLPQARLFGPTGHPLGGIFWVSERDNGTNATITVLEGRRPRVAWRGDSIAVIWESLNSLDTVNRVVSARLFNVPGIGTPLASGLTPRTQTFDVNTELNNTSTESTGVGIAANGNVIIGWEDDSLEDYQIFFWGAIWTLFDRDGMPLLPTTNITNIVAEAPYNEAQTVETTYRAYFRADGTPTPGNTGWGPKIKANLFGDGMGMGSSTYFLGREVTNFFDINVDSGGGDDFPSVQLINNNGTPARIVSMGDADVEPSGGVRIADWEHLSNGNIVIVGESRQADDRMLTGQTGGNTPVYRVVTPAGAQVKAYTAASSEPAAGDMWHGVGVTANGFALRFNQGGAATVRMFDNSGNPTTTNINLATLTGHAEAGGGGRGDGAGFHGNGRDAYVHVATGGGTPWVTVLNADGSLRWSRKVAEDTEMISSDRVDGAIAADGRVIAVYDENNTTGFRLPQARLFSANGVPIGTRFWLSERDQPAPGGTALAEARRPRAAWRDGCIAVIWESLNSLDTVNRVVSARLFDVAPPIAITSIADDGANVTIKWSGGGPTYSVTSRSSITGGPVTLATALTETTFTTPKTGEQAYYSVSSP